MLFIFYFNKRNDKWFIVSYSYVSILDENFSGKSAIIENVTTNDKYQRLSGKGLDAGIHVTFDRHPIFEKFDDKVNSMKCVCL